jgi:hypothetical protein
MRNEFIALIDNYHQIECVSIDVIANGTVIHGYPKEGKHSIGYIIMLAIIPIGKQVELLPKE